MSASGLASVLTACISGLSGAGVPTEERLAKEDQAGRIKKLEAELRRVTEERDILKKAAAYFAKQSG